MITYQDVLSAMALDYSDDEVNAMIDDDHAELTNDQMSALRGRLAERRLLAELTGAKWDDGTGTLGAIVRQAVEDAGDRAPELTTRDIIAIVREATEFHQIERDAVRQ